MDIGNLEERISKERLSERIELLKRRVKLTSSPGIIMGYCASNEEIFEKVSEYIREQLDIPRESVFCTEVPLDRRNMISYLINHQRELSNCPGEVTLLKIKGFERLGSLAFPPMIHRAAHDYDQDVTENNKKRFPNLTKKVLIITCIGDSLGREIYEAAVRSACISQFKSFLYEF